MAANTDLWANDSVGSRTYISELPTGKSDQDGLSGQYRSGCYGSFGGPLSPNARSFDTEQERSQAYPPGVPLDLLIFLFVYHYHP